MRIAVIVAKKGNDRRRVFRINRKKDGSIIVEPESRTSMLQQLNPHVSAHQSGKWHVKYGTPKGRRRSRVKHPLPSGQPISQLQGCTALCVHVIQKQGFNRMKRFNSEVPPEFEVDMTRFTSDLVSVAVFLFDPGSLALFQSEAAKFPSSISKVISSSQPNIGLVAHE